MIPRVSLLHPPYRQATQRERTAIREFVASASERLSALTVLPVILLIVALTRRERFMESEEECGDCRKPSLKCRCGGEGGGS